VWEGCEVVTGGDLAARQMFVQAVDKELSRRSGRLTREDAEALCRTGDIGRQLD